METTETENTIKIERVRIDQFKCLKDFEQNIEGKCIMLVGDNELGKTSIAQFIQIALGRKSNIPPGKPGKGEVIITKDGKEYQLKVKIEDGKSYVTIKGPDGMSDDKKGTLAALIGAVEFDIDEFVQLSKSKSGQKKQVEIFKSFLDDETRMDIAKFEANVTVAYNERTELNRTLTEMQGSVKSNPLYHLPPQELDKISFTDTTKALAELKALQDHNTKHNQVLVNFNARATALVSLNSELEAIKKKIADAESLQKQAGEWMKTNPLRDTKELETKISTASDNNTNHALAQDLKKKNALIKSMIDEAGELGAKIDSWREAILNAVRGMNTPVEGLTFDDEKLIYRGQPVHPEVLSESQIMELGMLMKIAENPKLGVVFLERTESYGKKRWEDILSICKKNRLQIIGEKVKYGQQELTVEIFSA